LFDSKVNQFQALSKPVSKTLSVKKPIEMIKQLVVFHFFVKHYFLKGFDLNQLCILTKSGFTNPNYPKPTHTRRSKAFNQSSWIWRHQSSCSIDHVCGLYEPKQGMPEGFISAS